MWRGPEQQERDRRIFEEELASFIPERVLDFHVHVINEGVCEADDPYDCAGHPLTKFDYDDLRQASAQALPGRQVYGVCFGTPGPSRDWQANNRYLSEASDHERFFPLRLFNPRVDTPDGLRADLEQSRFYGLKPYPDFVGKADVTTVEIHEMLPAWCMEIVDRLGLIIMLHVPRKGRLADPLNQQQVIELAKRYPNARIVLAHIGRAYFLKCVVGQLDDLKGLANVYFDLAMLNHWEVLKYTFEQIPADRLLFGTDIPIALAAGKSVEINDQYTYITPVPWKLSILDDHGKIAFTSFLNEQLRAIKKAVQQAGLGDSFVEKLFFDSGMQLLGKL